MWFTVLLSYVLQLCLSAEYYYDHHKLSEYRDGSCNSRHYECILAESDQYLLKKFSATSPYDCCKTCLSTKQCKSWTHYYEDITVYYQYQTGDDPMCELYSVYLNDSSMTIEDGNCVNGERFIGDRPNFVLYYPDTIRAEYLSAYDFPIKTTPRIDAFAKDGVTFLNHIAQHSECSPSRMAMLTGRYMHNLGKRTLSNLIQQWEPNYLRWLKDNGYYVVYIGKNDAFSIESASLSTNVWYYNISFASGYNEYQYGESGYYSFLFNGSDVNGDDESNGDYATVLQTKYWLETNGIEPFIIFIPTRGGHPPYGAPKDYQNMYNPKRIEKIYPLRAPYLKNKPSYFSKEYGIPYYHNLTTSPKSLFYKLNAVFLAMTSYMDWIFGELVDTVRTTSNGKYADTVIFMSSDHGDYSGDHRFVEKWPGGMEDQLIRIPLVASIPNSPINGKRIKVETTTQSFDIFETMFDLANINSTGYTTYGNSLKDYLINGEHRDNIDYDKLAFSEGGFYWKYQVFPGGNDRVTDPTSLYYPKNAQEQQFNGTGCPRVVAIRNVNYKLVYRGTNGYDISEFYDLKNDPKQLNNLYYNEDITQRLKDIKHRLLSNLTNWYLLTADITPILRDPRGAPAQVDIFTSQSSYACHAYGSCPSERYSAHIHHDAIVTETNESSVNMIAYVVLAVLCLAITVYIAKILQLLLSNQKQQPV